MTFTIGDKVKISSNDDEYKQFKGYVGEIIDERLDCYGVIFPAMFSSNQFQIIDENNLQLIEKIIKEEKLPNLTILGNGFFVVRTQAGFKKALKQYGFGKTQDDITKISNYPTKYPALIHLSISYQGYHYIEVGILQNCKEVRFD